jgi:hypothetical protein
VEWVATGKAKSFLCLYLSFSLSTASFYSHACNMDANVLVRLVDVVGNDAPSFLSPRGRAITNGSLGEQGGVIAVAQTLQRATKETDGIPMTTLLLPVLTIRWTRD